MNNKKYIRILAEVAIVISATGMMTGCVNKKTEDVNSSQADIIITTDEETTIEETTTDEIIADSNSNIESSNSQNDNSESSKVEFNSEPDSSSNTESIEIEVSPQNDLVNNYSENIIVETVPTSTSVIGEIPQELCEAVEDTTPVLVEETPTEVATIADYTPSDLYNQGRLYWGDSQYTWYSEHVLPGYGLAIDGRHTDADGFVCDGDGYICVAASSLSKGTVVDTPFGRQGKVYDTGCDWGVIDVYVGW